MKQDFCFHIHTPRCGHADVNMPDDVIARSFYEAGFKEIAFTDHNPWKTFMPERVNHCMKWSQKDEYVSSIRSLAEQYNGKMKILTGFEMEYVPDCKDEMDELKSDSDILIIGQHITRATDGTYIRMHQKGYAPNDFEMDFYADCLENACKDKYANILAHPDLYMIHKTEFGKKEAELAHRICEIAVNYNVPLEINLCTLSEAKFYRQVPISYPRREFWEIAARYKDLKVLFGLDFHGHFQACEMDGIIDDAVKVIGENTISKLNLIHSL